MNDSRDIKALKWWVAIGEEDREWKIWNSRNRERVTVSLMTHPYKFFPTF